MSLFLQNTSGEAMKTGVLYLRILSPFYFAIAIKLIADGLLRGGSAIRSFMVSTFSDLILRVILAFVFSRIWGSIGIWLAWPVGWVLSTGLSFYYYKKGVWRNK